MKNKISFSDWLLLGLAGLIDFLSETKDPLNIVNNYYETYYGYVPLRFQKQNLSYAIWKSLKETKIKKISRKKRIYYSVTQDFREILKKKYPIFRHKKYKMGW